MNGEIIDKSRESIVLHEMLESYNRTDGEMEYEDAHSNANNTEKEMRQTDSNDIRTSNNQGNSVDPVIKK